LLLKEEVFGEMRVLRQEMQTLRQEMETLHQKMETKLLRLDRKFTIMFIVLFFTIIFFKPERS